MSVLYRHKKPATAIEIEVYETKFDFEKYDVEKQIIEEIVKKEVIIVNNAQQIERHRKELAKNLYESQQLLANNKNGVFGEYLNYLNIKKDTAYRLIDMWKIFLDTDRERIFELSHKIVNFIKKEIKSDEKNIVADIVEILEADNPGSELKNYKEKQVEKDEVVDSVDIEKKVKKIDSRIKKLYEEIAKLELEKNELSKL